MIPRCPHSLCNLWEWITDWGHAPSSYWLRPRPGGSLDHVANWPRIWESRRPVWSALCTAPHNIRSTGRGSLIKPVHFLLFSFLYDLFPCKKNYPRPAKLGQLVSSWTWTRFSWDSPVLDTFILVLALLCWLNCNSNQFTDQHCPSKTS